MCLDKVTDFTPKQSGRGVKIFLQYGPNSGFNPYYMLVPCLPLGKWVHDQPGRMLKSKYNQDYDAGFHIFTKIDFDFSFFNHEELMWYLNQNTTKICEVEYRNVEVKGIDNTMLFGSTTVVAKSIRIIRVLETVEEIKEVLDREDK